MDAPAAPTPMDAEPTAPAPVAPPAEPAAAADADSDVELEGVDLEEDDDAADDGGDDGEYVDEAAAPPPVPVAPRAPAKVDTAVEEARRLQKERLAKLREFGSVGTGGDPAAQRDTRMAYLMAQSEVFSHFMEENAESAIGKKGSKKKGRTRMTEAAEDARLMKAAQSNQRTTRVTHQPKNITATMRAYQVEGLNWLVKLFDNGINGILADEMGLGKTLQSISLLAYLCESRDIRGPHICIVPKSVVNNWMREIRKWCPTLRPVKLLGDKHERARVLREELRDPNSFDVCVTSYEGVLKEKAGLCKINWRYLLIDEAHRIKNPNSSLSKVVRTIPTQYRLLITGTPLQNNLNELWALLNFLLPDIFSSEADFEKWFSVGDEEGKENVVKKLHTVLRPFMLRRIKKDVEANLPPKREIKLYIGLTEMQRLWYTKILSKDAHTLNALGGPDRVRLLNILMQLRKVCNHPYLFEGAEPGPPFLDGPHLWENTGKLVLLSKLLPKLQSQDSRVLIFSQMTRMLDILEDFMRLKRYQYCRIDGGTSGDDRDSQMDVFNAPGSPKFAFLLSTRAGGLGINLATADIVVLYDSDWNPQVDLQAMDRAHRIGQTKPVTVFRFVSEGTVEEKIIERADRKLFLDAAVIQQGRLAEQNAKVGKTDLMAMVRFGADEIFASKSKQLTDEDIDVLLKRGEERTAEEGKKIQTDVQHNLANFSLTTVEEGGSLFDFEGRDYKDKGSGLFINLPTRERKRNYDVDEYFGGEMGKGSGKKKERKEKRRGPPMHDFQFFNKPELEALLKREEELEKEQKAAAVSAKELRARATAAQAAPPADGGAESLAALVEAADAADAALETNYELPPKDLAKKEKLLKEGFGDWSRKDLRAYTNAMERKGRHDVETVAKETAQETGKSEADVKRYHAVFWKKYQELADWERLVDKVEKGEKKLQRSEEIKTALAEKIGRAPKPYECLPLNYGASRGKVWTEEEDAFLVNMMHLYGYGNWERIRVEIRNAWQFNFDWFFKSRNAQELQRRADLLIRIVEKENDDHKRAAGDSPAKASSLPAESSPADLSAPKKPRSRARKRGAAAADAEAPAKKVKADADAPMA